MRMTTSKTTIKNRWLINDKVETVICKIDQYRSYSDVSQFEQ